MAVCVARRTRLVTRDVHYGVRRLSMGIVEIATVFAERAARFLRGLKEEREREREFRSERIDR
mgnify:CR=1 FL=1